MSSDEHALVIRGLGKTYRIRTAAARPNSVGEAIRDRARHPFRRVPREGFAALKDINAVIGAGEAVGIIGHNGAGKSTLLKVISRITRPTVGRVEVRGRVGSLLEVGTGFHGELTGRENIYLNGAILGMRKRDIRRNFDSIVEFAEVQRFLDTPVKRYSSGMYVRLAFAIAAHLNPDILIVDEVLAVGDIQFQRRSLGKMSEVSREQGRTVLFVSHNMTAIQAFCSRTIQLEHGRIAFDGPTEEGIQRYLSVNVEEQVSAGVFDLSERPRTGTQQVVLRRAELRTLDGTVSNTFRMGEGLVLVLDVDGLKLPEQHLAVRIRSPRDIAIVSVDTMMRPVEVDDTTIKPDQVVLRIPSLNLNAGQYRLEAEVIEGPGTMQRALIDRVERAASFHVLPTDLYGNGFQMGPGPDGGLVFADPQWEVLGEGLVVAQSGR